MIFETTYETPYDSQPLTIEYGVDSGDPETGVRQSIELISATLNERSLNTRDGQIRQMCIDKIYEETDPFKKIEEFDFA